MLRTTCLGLTFCLTQVPLALAQKPPLVTDLCPQATWTAGYHVGELMFLHSDQYRSAVVITETPLRVGYGFESMVMTNLAAGAQVTIMGEVWNMGCNQWMAVAGNQQTYFVYGSALLNLEN